MSTENNHYDMLNSLVEPSSGTEDWNVFLEGQRLRQEVYVSRAVCPVVDSWS